MSKIKDLDRVYKNIIGNDAYYDKNVTNKSIVRDFSNRFDKLQICFISDMHIGSSDFDIKGLIENLKYAESQENAVIFFLGDSMNTAIVGSKSDSYEDVMSPQGQLSFYSKILKLAKGDQKLTDVLTNLNNSGKIIVVHSGNHEDRITRAVGVSTTKMAADVAGVGDVYAPFFASTTLILRQPDAPGGKFPVRIITHHGTGIHNTDGVFKLVRNMPDADIAVAGHIHDLSMTAERTTIKEEGTGKQYYHKIIEISLPASGGGTYGAGMALPDVAKQSGVWVEVCSQRNPFAGKISPTGVYAQDFIPSAAFFTPSNSFTTDIQAKRNRQAKTVIKGYEKADLYDAADKFLGALLARENEIFGEITGVVAEKPLKEPSGFAKYLEEKYNAQNQGEVNEEIEDEQGEEPEM